MSDEFFITPYQVRSAGTDVPPEEVQAAINSLAHQVTVDLNLISSGGFPQTNVNITGGTISGTVINVATQGYLDNSTLAASDAFVKQEILAATAEIPIASFTGGTYNFATVGSGAALVVFATGGVVSSILTVSNPGSGYQVGDCLILVGGNGDAIARVASVSGSGIASCTILYGGTAYTTGQTLAGSPLPPGSRTANLNGVLTSNALIIIPAGTYLQGARRISFSNNTTGSFTTTVKLSNGAGGSTGVGVVLPQGTANSSSVLLYTDGVTDVWPEVTLQGLGATSFASAFLAYFNALPKTLPGSAGVIWNNGGTLAQS